MYSRRKFKRGMAACMKRGMTKDQAYHHMVIEAIADDQSESPSQLRARERYKTREHATGKYNYRG